MWLMSFQSDAPPAICPTAIYMQVLSLTSSGQMNVPFNFGPVATPQEHGALQSWRAFVPRLQALINVLMFSFPIIKYALSYMSL